MARSMSIRMDLEQCLACNSTAPELGQELCATCNTAWKHCSGTDSGGRCPICWSFTDLYNSDYFARDIAWCGSCAVKVTRAEIERRRPDFSHIGDVRNIA